MLGSWCFFQAFSHTTNLKRWVCCYLLDCLFFDVWHQKRLENNRMHQPTLQTQMQLLISYHNHQNGRVTVAFAFHLWQDLESIFRAPQCPPEVFLGACCCRVNQNCSFHPFEKHLTETKVKIDRKITKIRCFATVLSIRPPWNAERFARQWWNINTVFKAFEVNFLQVNDQIFLAEFHHILRAKPMVFVFCRGKWSKVLDLLRWYVNLFLA